ncbi:Protein MgtC (modular protein) [Hyphomicrobiales bacterium]|nr:Protein MgtC (modular protein) [Hyphomicrobiales bacterium]CAH1700101.1 Protein MgtC (modular protein) [Hyphomicrobiales bacterium]CAI0343862.1 putative Mg2+ transporter-C (MgtC) family protein [Hyphomicrobiales bacterium]
MDEIELVLRLLAGLAAGLVVGWQRTVQRKSAGLRTFGLVGIGTAAAASLFSETLHPDAASRVVQGVLTGIGFLGAGLIIHRNGETMPHGLTTAAAIWVTAALGCSAGLGKWLVTLTATALALILLVIDHSLERRLHPWPRTTMLLARLNKRRHLREGRGGAFRWLGRFRPKGRISHDAVESRPCRRADAHAGHPQPAAGGPAADAGRGAAGSSHRIAT